MARFCGKCGAMLNETTGLCPNCNQNQVKPKNNSALTAVLCCIVGVLLVFCIVAAIAFFDVAYIPGISDFFAEKKNVNVYVVQDADPQATVVNSDADVQTDPYVATTQNASGTWNQNSGANVNQTIPIYSVSSSSDQGSGKYNRTFVAQNTIDGDYNTCWMVASDLSGRGQWIQFDFGTPQTVSGVKLLNGNGWNGYYNGEKVENGLYDLNGRIKDFVLTFSDGSSRRFTAADVREETYGVNIFYFDQPVTTQYIRLFIESGYEGSKWKTVACLSEFAAF